MNLDQMTGAAGTINLNNKTYVICKLALDDLGTITAWVKEHVPCPYQQAAERLEKIAFMKDINPELWKQRTEKYLVEAELEERKREDNLPLSLALQLHGFSFVIWMAVRKNHPDVTIETIQADIKEQNKMNPAHMNEVEEKILKALFKTDPPMPAVPPTA